MANVEAEGAVIDTDKIIKNNLNDLGEKVLANRKQSGKEIRDDQKTNRNYDHLENATGIIIQDITDEILKDFK
jgi:rRNA maturation endonuclease Nob1